MGRILAVDDREDNLELVRLLILGMGHEFYGVSTPETVIEMVRSVQPDLILMDLALPNTDGIELTQRIQQEVDPTIPIIAVTALPEHFSQAVVASAGCAAFLSKPFTTKQLSSLVEKHIRQ